MNVADKLKKEPRIIIAAVIFLSFFLKWISIEVSYDVVGYEGGAAASISGFGIMDYSVFGIAFYAIPLAIIVTAFVDQIEQMRKYIYLALPAVELILMFMIGTIVGKGYRAESGYGDAVEIEIIRQIGFWVALAGNIAIIGYTLMRDYNIRSGEDLKRGISSIDVGNIASQVSDAARDIQQNVFMVCPDCGNRVTKGKKFCSKCGHPFSGSEAEKIKQQESVKQQENVCPNCGSKVGKNAKFCPECGEKIQRES